MTEPIEIRRRTHAQQLHAIANDLTQLCEDMATNGIHLDPTTRTRILAAAIITGAIAAQMTGPEQAR